MFYQGEFLDSFLRRVKLRAFGHLPNHSNHGFPPLTQFTGLADKSGNKIFEGDVVQAEFDIENLFLEVVYNLETASYEFVDTSNEKYSLLDLKPYSLEIIGNIYEKRN